MTQASDHSGFAVEWHPLDVVASALCASYEVLRKHAKRGTVATQIRRDLIHCQAFAAYDVLAGSRRPPTNLRRPDGYGRAGGADLSSITPEFDEEIRRALVGADLNTLDPHELSRRLLLAGVAAEKIRLAVSVANGQLRKREAEVRAGKSFAPEDVIRMLRSGSELFVDQVDAGVSRWSAELLRVLRAEYGLDIAKFPNARARLEDFYREQANTVIVACRKQTDDQIRGIQALELTA